MINVFETHWWVILNTEKRGLHQNEVLDEVLDKDINFTPLFKSIEDLKIAAAKINSERRVLLITKNKSSICHIWVLKKRLNFQAIQGSEGCASMWTSKPWQAKQLNDRLMMAERAFVDRDGLLGRRWYKHLVCLSLHKNLINVYVIKFWVPNRYSNSDNLQS